MRDSAALEVPLLCLGSCVHGMGGGLAARSPLAYMDYLPCLAYLVQDEIRMMA